jgi:hypothetical protein
LDAEGWQSDTVDFLAGNSLLLVRFGRCSPLGFSLK